MATEALAALSLQVEPCQRTRRAIAGSSAITTASCGNASIRCPMSKRPSAKGKPLSRKWLPCGATPAETWEPAECSPAILARPTCA